MGIWTDEEISTLVSMWPTNSVTQIAMRLIPPPGSHILARQNGCTKRGCWKDKEASREPEKKKKKKKKNQSTPVRKISTR